MNVCPIRLRVKSSRDKSCDLPITPILAKGRQRFPEAYTVLQRRSITSDTKAIQVKFSFLFIFFLILLSESFSNG